MIPTRWLIERVETKRSLLDAIDAWKELSRQGWDLTIVLTPDRGSLIAFGYKPTPDLHSDHARETGEELARLREAPR